MKVYVAGPSLCYLQCRALMNELEKMGCEITCDWTKEFFDTCYFDSEFIAARDIRGVNDADCVVFMARPLQPTTGAWFEMGYALAANKRVIVYAKGDFVDMFPDWMRRNVFLHSPGVTIVKSLEDLEGALKKTAWARSIPMIRPGEEAKEAKEIKEAG